LLANDKLLLCFRIGFLPSSLEPCFYRISLTYHFRTQHLQCHTTKIPTAADVAVTATARSVEAKATALNVEARAPIAAMTNVVKAASAESDVRKEEDMVAIDEKSMANVVKKAQDMAAVEKGARNTESVAKAAVASAAVSEGTTMTARVAGMEEMERGAMRLVEAMVAQEATEARTTTSDVLRLSATMIVPVAAVRAMDRTLRPTAAIPVVLMTPVRYPFPQLPETFTNSTST
jgi:hypothetical protein